MSLYDKITAVETLYKKEDRNEPMLKLLEEEGITAETKPYAEQVKDLKNETHWSKKLFPGWVMHDPDYNAKFHDLEVALNTRNPFATEKYLKRIDFRRGITYTIGAGIAIASGAWYLTPIAWGFMELMIGTKDAEITWRMNGRAKKIDETIDTYLGSGKNESIQ